MKANKSSMRKKNNINNVGKDNNIISEKMSRDIRNKLEATRIIENNQTELNIIEIRDEKQERIKEINRLLREKIVDLDKTAVEWKEKNKNQESKVNELIKEFKEELKNHNENFNKNLDDKNRYYKEKVALIQKEKELEEKIIKEGKEGGEYLKTIKDIENTRYIIEKERKKVQEKELEIDALKKEKEKIIKEYNEMSDLAEELIRGVKKENIKKNRKLGYLFAKITDKEKERDKLNKKILSKEEEVKNINKKIDDKDKVQINKEREIDNKYYRIYNKFHNEIETIRNKEARLTHRKYEISKEQQRLLNERLALKKRSIKLSNKSIKLKKDEEKNFRKNDKDNKSKIRKNRETRRLEKEKKKLIKQKMEPLQNMVYNFCFNRGISLEYKESIYKISEIKDGDFFRKAIGKTINGLSIRNKNYILDEKKGIDKVIIHEYIHYLSQNDSNGVRKRGISINGKNNFINEALTEYFTKQAMADKYIKDNSCLYNEALKVVELIIPVLGEERVSVAYFQNKPELLKDKFNAVMEDEDAWDNFSEKIDNICHYGKKGDAEKEKENINKATEDASKFVLKAKGKKKRDRTLVL